MDTDIRSIEDLIKEKVADVVIILHRPPRIDGLAITEGLRFQRLGVPIILIDPAANPGFHRAAISAGADFSLGGMDDPQWKETLANNIKEAVSLRKCQDISCKSGVLCGHIFQTLPVGFALLEHVKSETSMPPEYRYLDMNQEFQRLMGYPSHDLIGLSLHDCILQGLNHPVLDVMDLLDQVSDERLPLRREVHYDIGQGSMDILAYAPCPNMIAIVASESLDSEMTVNQSTEGDLGFFDHANDLAAIIDMDGRVVRANRLFVSKSGFNNRDISKARIHDLMGEAMGQRFLQESKPILSKNGLYRTTGPLRTKDGRWLDIEWSAWSDQRNVYLIGADRTDSILEEHMMQKGVAVSDYLLQMSSDMDYGRLTDIALDMSGAKYAVFNLYAEDGTRFQTMALSVRKQESGDDPRSVCILGSLHEEHPELQKASKILGFDLRGRVWSHDKDIEVRTRGRTITVFPSLETMTGQVISPKITRILQRMFRLGDCIHIRLEHSGRLLGNFTLIMTRGRQLQGRDMLEIFAHQVGTLLMRRRAEKQAEVVNRKLEIIGDVTRHDVLNQVTVLQGYMELIRHNCTDPRSLVHLEKMTAAADNIQQFFEFARQYEGLGKEQPDWVPLSQLVARSVQGMLPLKDECTQVSIMADPILEKVFFNLMDNTVRHGAGATYARLSHRRERDQLVIVWEDDGLGVEDEKKGSIFQRGFGKNTGFGLFMTKEVLEMLGMSIIETGTHGKGARFEIRVPMGMYR
ncbi:MAG: ATP-binding protein, partial [Candidatus Methanomethylophilaceae archaeon]